MEDEISEFEARIPPRKHKKPRNYSIEDPLYTFLYKYDLDSYYGDLKLQGVTYENLPYLKRENLLTIPIGPRNRLLLQIKQLKVDQQSEEEEEDLSMFVSALIEKQQRLLEAFNEHQQMILELQQQQNSSLYSEINKKTKSQQIEQSISRSTKQNFNVSPLRMEWRWRLRCNNR